MPKKTATSPQSSSKRAKRRSPRQLAIDVLREHTFANALQARATVMTAILALEKRGGVDGEMAIALRLGALNQLRAITTYAENAPR